MRRSALLCAFPAMMVMLGCNGTNSTGFAPVALDGSGNEFKRDRAAHVAAAPATVVDQNGTSVFVMRELWLTVVVASSRLESQDVEVTLSHPGPINIMTLDNTSVLFALGTFPAGNYEAVEFTIASAVMVGNDVTGPEPAPMALELEIGKAGVFEVEFRPSPVLIAPNSPTPVIIDFKPSVKATSKQDGSVEYELEDGVRALVAGN